MTGRDDAATQQSRSGQHGQRRPQVFDADDPSLEPAREPEPPQPEGPDPADASSAQPVGMSLARGVRWGAIMFAALTAASTFALSLWFYRLVSVGLWRDDWAGMLMRGLVGVVGIALLAIVLREIIGFSRLGRLNRLRTELERVHRAPDPKAEQSAVRRLSSLYAGRRELGWARDRLHQHGRDVHDPGALLQLSDRELMAPLDAAARRIITASARRVATVTALSPMATLAVGYVLYANLSQLRSLAALYGGRPGFLGTVRLARLVVGHLVASGSVALTDDLVGQFIGQDLLRRLSKRLGEGAFNGALTARVGVAAIPLLRPLPHIESKPPRVRDIVAEALRREKKPGADGN